MNYSVIIPAYNAAETIEQCLQSLLHQDVPPSVAGEIIVINDGSGDGTREILEELASLDSDIRIVHHRVNKGLASARNSGLRKASGDILFLLDSDMVAESGYIRSHLDHYSKDADIDGIVNRYIPGNEVPETKFTKYLYRNSRGAARAGVGGTVPTHQVIFGCTSIRRSIYTQIGGFDEKISVYGGEDTEYAFRIARQTDSRFIFTAKTSLRHHHYRTLEQTESLLYEYGRKSLPYLIGKYPELGQHVGLNLIGWRTDSSFSSFKSAIFLSRFAEKLGRSFYEIMPAPLSHLAARYLLGINLLRGFLQGQGSCRIW